MKVIYDLQKLTADFVECIKRSGLKQIDVAKLTELSASAVNRFVNGNTSYPREEHIDAILKFMNKTEDEYIITSKAFVRSIDAIDIDSMSVEEIDLLIERLVVIRKQKLISRLLAEIRSEESYILGLLEKEIDR